MDVILLAQPPVIREGSVNTTPVENEKKNSHKTSAEFSILDGHEDLVGQEEEEETDGRYPAPFVNAEGEDSQDCDVYQSPGIDSRCRYGLYEEAQDDEEGCKADRDDSRDPRSFDIGFDVGRYLYFSLVLIFHCTLPLITTSCMLRFP